MCLQTSAPNYIGSNRLSILIYIQLDVVRRRHLRRLAFHVLPARAHCCSTRAAVQGNTFICSWPPPPISAFSDFVYHGAEIASLALAVGCVVLMSTKFKSTYQQDVDSFGALHVPTEWGTLYIFVPCLLLAMVSLARGLDLRDVERVELVCCLCS